MKKNNPFNLIKIESYILFLTGFFGLSSLSIIITRSVSLPYLIELFFLPLLVYYLSLRKLIFKQKFNIYGISLFYFILLYVISSTIIGVINTKNVSSIVTAIRPFIYLISLVFFFSSSTFQISLTKIFLLSFGTLVGEAFYKIFVIANISDIDHINTIALSLFILIPFIQKKYILASFTSLFAILLAFTTLYRRIILFAIIAILIGILYTFFKLKPLKKSILFFSSFSIIFFIYFNYLPIIEFIIEFLSLNGNNNFYLSASYRLITKLTSFESASDAVRISVLEEIFTQFYYKIIPLGPIGKFKGIDYFGAYTDTTNVFLYDVFGSLVSLILVFSLLIHSVYCFLKVLFTRIKDNNIILSGLMVPSLILFLFLDGTFLVHANISIPASLAFFGLFKKQIKSVNL
jgi:hypothetical protein